MSNGRLTSGCGDLASHGPILLQYTVSDCSCPISGWAMSSQHASFCVRLPALSRTQQVHAFWLSWLCKCLRVHHHCVFWSSDDNAMLQSTWYQGIYSVVPAETVLLSRLGLQPDPLLMLMRRHARQHMVEPRHCVCMVSSFLGSASKYTNSWRRLWE